MIKFNIKHNIQKEGISFLEEIKQGIVQSKKELHRAGAHAALQEVKEHYHEAFNEVVNPASTWQRVKKELGLPAQPGEFTGSTLNSLIAEATAEMGRVALKGKWPDKAKRFKAFGDRVEVTPAGVKIKPFRDDKRGIRIAGFFIPSEPFETKKYGSWIGEDIDFMRPTPTMERAVTAGVQRVLDTEINRIVSRRADSSSLRQYINELFRKLDRRGGR